MRQILDLLIKEQIIQTGIHTCNRHHMPSVLFDAIVNALGDEPVCAFFFEYD